MARLTVWRVITLAVRIIGAVIAGSLVFLVLTMRNLVFSGEEISWPLLLMVLICAIFVGYGAFVLPTTLQWLWCFLRDRCVARYEAKAALIFATVIGILAGGGTYVIQTTAPWINEIFGKGSFLPPVVIGVIIFWIVWGNVDRHVYSRPHIKYHE